MFAYLFDSYLDDAPVAFHPPPWVSIVAIVSLTITVLLAMLIYLGIWISGLATLSAVIAFGLWLRLGYAIAISRRALPGHILLIIAMLLHGAELYAGGYASSVIAAFPHFVQPPNIITDASLAMTLSLSATVIWLLGGALVFYQIRVGGFILLLLTTWSVVFPLGHLVLALATSLWVPGMASGAIPVILALMSIRYISTQSKSRTCT